MECTVCGYRSTFEDGAAYPVHKARYHGLSMIFETDIVVCEEHKDWASEDFPETFGPLSIKESGPGQAGGE